MRARAHTHTHTHTNRERERERGRERGRRERETEREKIPVKEMFALFLRQFFQQSGFSTSCLSVRRVKLVTYT